MSDSLTLRLLLAFGLSAVFACTNVEVEPEAAPVRFASDEEALHILQAVTAKHWNPLAGSNRSGLLCLPLFERKEWNAYLGDLHGHQGHIAFWEVAPESLMMQLQEDANELHARSDQTSGKLLYSTESRGLRSMNNLHFSRPVLHDSGLTATVWLEVSSGSMSPDYRCCHLERLQNGEWMVNDYSYFGGTIN